MADQMLKDIQKPESHRHPSEYPYDPSPESPESESMERVNVYIPSEIVDQIDAKADNRSGFIRRAVRRELAESDDLRVRMSRIEERMSRMEKEIDNSGIL